MAARRSNFINDADEALARSAFEQLVPQPYPYLVEQAKFTTFYSLTVRKSYILPTEDTQPLRYTRRCTQSVMISTAFEVAMPPPLRPTSTMSRRSC